MADLTKRKLRPDIYNLKELLSQFYLKPYYTVFLSSWFVWLGGSLCLFMCVCLWTFQWCLEFWCWNWKTHLINVDKSDKRWRICENVSLHPLNLLLKGKDNQKLKLSFTHPHVVPNLHDFLSFFRQRLKKIFWKMSNGFSHIQLNFVSDLSFLVELSL